MCGGPRRRPSRGRGRSTATRFACGRKLKDTGASRQLVIGVQGVGYRLCNHAPERAAAETANAERGVRADRDRAGRQHDRGDPPGAGGTARSRAGELWRGAEQARGSDRPPRLELAAVELARAFARHGDKTRHVRAMRSTGINRPGRRVRRQAHHSSPEPLAKRRCPPALQVRPQTVIPTTRKKG